MQKNKFNRPLSYLFAFGHLCSDINQGSLSALLPFLIAAHNYNYATATMLVMASNIVGSVIQPIFGWLADKHSRPYIMSVGVLLAGGGMALTGWLDNFYGICAAVMLSGVGVAMFHPQAAQLVNRNADPNHKGTDLGIFSFGGNLGFTIGPLLTSAFISLFGLRGTLVYFLPALLFSFVTTLVFRDAETPAAEQPVETTASKIKAAAAVPVPDNWGAFGCLSLLVVCRSIIYSGINTFLVLYFVTNYGLDKNVATVFLSVYYAIAAVSALLGGRLADNFGSRRMIRLAFGILLLGLLLFSMVNNILLLLGLLLPLGIGISLGYSPMVLLGQTYLPNHVGFASGVTLGLVVSVGGIVSPVLGRLADLHGLGAVFGALTVISVVPLLLSWLLPAPRHLLNARTNVDEV